MNGFRIAPFLLAALALAGCARPESVRRVARLSQPIAVEIQRSGAELEIRMAVQAQAIESNSAAVATEEVSARMHADGIERDFRLSGDEASLRKLAVMRESDAALLADPLSPIAPPAAPAAAPRPRLDFSSLDGVIAGFGRMSEARPPDLADLASFGRDAIRELRKIKDESAAPPATAENGPGN